jgi:hypothetical protein
MAKPGYLRNYFVMNLLGRKDHVECATIDICNILKQLNISHKTINIHPTLLARQPNNNMPNWRVELRKELESPEDIIINKVNDVNCDELTDLTRSIRALSRRRDTYALFAKPVNNKKFQYPLEKFFSEKSYKEQSYDIELYELEKCHQVNSVFPINATDEIKLYEVGTYLKDYIYIEE